LKGKPQDWMRLGLVHPMAFPDWAVNRDRLIETVVAVCDDPWFGLIELGRIEDAESRKAVAAICSGTNTGILIGAQAALLANKLDLNSADESQRQKAVELVKSMITEAADMQASAVIVLSGPDPGEKQRASAYQALTKSLCELSECAEARGLSLLLETFDRLPIGKKRLTGPTGEAIEIAAKVSEKHPSFGLLLDLSHLPLLGESSESAISLAAPFLKHVHAGNCVMQHPDHPTYGDNHPIFSIPEGENGAPELAEFIRCQKQMGYINEEKPCTFSFEIKPFGNQTSADVIGNMKQTLASAWDMID